jgi:hypothetical protein
LVCEAIGTAAPPGLLCQPWVIVKMIVEKQMECRLAGETEVLRENLPLCHFCPSQNPTDQTWVWTRAATVGSRRLTAWAMARPTVTCRSRALHWSACRFCSTITVFLVVSWCVLRPLGLIIAHITII